MTEPYQTNARGDFLSHTLHERRSREVHDSGEWHYKMGAFGNKLHLKLRRNTQLVKPGLELETRHENGGVTRTSVESGSFLLGEETSDSGSLVALSNNKGLVRKIFVQKIKGLPIADLWEIYSFAEAFLKFLSKNKKSRNHHLMCCQH